MIDLPIAQEDEEAELHPRLMLFNHILGGISFLLLLIGIILIVQLLNGQIQVPSLRTFILVVLGVTVTLQLVDLVAWYFIQKQTEFNNEKALTIYFIPVVVDVFLVFLFGLGILLIFLRIIIYGGINPDGSVYEEDDPLFS